MALATTVQETVWFRMWLKEVFQVVVPIMVLCDNQAAIMFCCNDGAHQRSKHIDIRYHFIRDYVADGAVHIKSVKSAEQEADFLTKALPTSTLLVLRNKVMNVIS